ncbi:hypothetical protein ACJZ2D_009005 [Fusarium nematophilum]
MNTQPNGLAGEKKKWILNAFFMNQPTFVAPGLWRHPRNQTPRYNELSYWVKVAKLLDGNFHTLFLADVLGPYDVYKGPRNFTPVLAGAAQFPVSDPSAARSFGLKSQVLHEERYAIADEFLEVAYKLFERSWKDDAVVKDEALKQYTHPERVRGINHEGKYFQVAGPHLVEPSRQRTPFIFQAGASKAGKAFATKHAEAVFLPVMDIKAVKELVKEIRQAAVQQGRDPRGLKLIAGIHIVLDETDELAQKRYEEYLSYADLEGSLALFGGWSGTDLAQFPDDADLKFTGPPAMQSMVENWSETIPGSDGIRWTKARVAQELALGGPHARAVGSAKTVADVLERWVEETDVDGFNISYAVVPGDLEDHARLLVPELKSREVFWDAAAAEGMTMREVYLGGEYSLNGRLGSDHPGSRYKWVD